MRKVVFLLVILVCSMAAAAQEITQGSLFASDKKGKELGACPLKTTSVKADISGFLARVRVKQEFENSYAEAIEAVYTFPLSEKGAVDDMTMTVGDRVIRGKIMKREEAREVYEAAKSSGRTASLLDQQRPNIFTQSVANIMPGEKVTVEITYVETLKYEDGSYEFVFPMVVAPRYNPDGVADAAKLRTPITPTRPGHDISIEVNLNAGVPVEEIQSLSHAIQQINSTQNTWKVTLKDEKTIPNKDFVLRYDVSGKRIEDAVLAHRDERGGFFTMILQPPDKIGMEDRTPKEIVFVLDTSGSMSGFPIEKAKEAMRLSLDGLYPDDTFNLITFAGDTAILFDGPVPATQANLDRAQEFLAGRQGGGGTEMMKAIKASLEPSDQQDHLRIVCFMTDGEVGNENEIIAEVQRHPKARIFSFGIGNSVNRHLLEKIAQDGKGEAEFVGLNDDGSKAAKRFYERVRTPLLTDLSVDWNGMPVGDIYPNKLTDLFSAKPVIIHGRYDKAMAGTIKLKGFLAGQPYERSISIDLPESRAENDVLATLWARTQIDTLSSQTLNANAAKAADLTAQITDIGLKFGLMTQFTSFVAVEDKVVNPIGAPARKDVPVPVTDDAPIKVASPVTEEDVYEGSPVSTSQISSLPINGRNRKNSVNKLPAKKEVPVRSSANLGVAETVIVSSGNEVLQTNAATVGSSITGRQIVETPVQGRDALDLVTMLPGTATTAKGSSTTKSKQPSAVSATNSKGALVKTNVNKGVLAGSTAKSKQASNSRAARLDNPEPLLPPPATVGDKKFEKKFNRMGDPNGRFDKLSNGESNGGGTGSGRGTGSGNGFSYGMSAGVVNSSDSLNTFQIDSTDAKASTNGVPKIISGGVLNGKALNLPKPLYPAAALAVNAGGAVSVQVLIDEQGRVISATAVSGHPLLKAAAEQAAGNSFYAPTMLSGKPVKISGVITYNFVSGNSITTVPMSVMFTDMKVESLPVEQLSTINVRRRLLSEKLHTWLFALVARLDNGIAKRAENEAMFVHDGKADLRIDLKSISPAIREKLKAAGFEIVSEKRKNSLTGQIAIEKLALLADIDEILLVIPKI